MSLNYVEIFFLVAKRVNAKSLKSPDFYFGKILRANSEKVIAQLGLNRQLTTHIRKSVFNAFPKIAPVT
jgi:hypothetical protein